MPVLPSSGAHVSRQEDMGKSLIILLLLTVSAFAKKEVKEHFPKVLGMTGEVRVSADETKPTPLHDPRAEKLTFKKIETDAGARFRVAFSDTFEVTVLSSSRTQMLEKNKLSLSGGALRLKTKHVTLLDPYWVETPTAQVALAHGDFLISYNEDSGELQLQILNGEARVKGRGQNEEVTLSGSSRVSFFAALDQGEPVWDMLTHGQKMIRGYFSKVDVIRADMLAKLSEDSMVASLPPKPKKKVVVISKAELQKQRLQICEKPGGQFNQCLWTRQNDGSCARKRCNANGNWADEVRLPASYSTSCGQKPKVAPCDY